jgi:NitT/TauT family transport system substrate-binding protein
MSRRTWLAGALSAGTALSVGAPARADGLTSITLAEPGHNLGYLPFYMGMNAGFFTKHGLDVKLIAASGGAHVSALVAGQVWGNLGGPESDAMADVGKADPLMTICNMVNRANVYVMARKGLITKSMSNDQIASVIRGRTCAFNRFGGTPDICGRWYLEKIGLDPQKDVRIVNQADSAASPTMIKAGVADIAVASEPQITYGQEMGLWDEPFFSFPSLGDYTYSVISVRKSTITSQPAVVQAFVDAMSETLRVTATNRALVEVAARKEFPTLPESGLKGALDRSYADKLWSPDGYVSKQGYDLDMQIVAKSGEFTKSITYDDVVDMQFVKKTTRKGA